MPFDPDEYLKSAVSTETADSAFDPDSFVADTTKELVNNDDFEPIGYALETGDMDTAREVAWQKSQRPMSFKRVGGLVKRFGSSAVDMVKDFGGGLGDVAIDSAEALSKPDAPFWKNQGIDPATAQTIIERAKTQNLLRAQLAAEHSSGFLGKIFGSQGFLAPAMRKLDKLAVGASGDIEAPDAEAAIEAANREEADRQANPRKYFDAKFDAAFAHAKNAHEIEQGQVQQDDLIAKGLKGIDYAAQRAAGAKPEDIKSELNFADPAALAAQGAPIDTDSIRRGSTAVDPINLAPLHIPAAAPVLNKVAGAGLRAVAAPLRATVWAAERVPVFGKKMSNFAKYGLSGGIGVSAALHPVATAKALAGYTGTKVLGVLGGLIDNAGKKLINPKFVSEAERAAAEEVMKTGKRGFFSKAQNTADFERAATRTIQGIASAPVAMAPLNAMIADSPEEFASMEGGLAGFGGLAGATSYHPLHGFRPETVQAVDTILREQGSTKKYGTDLDTHHDAFMKSAPDWVKDGVNAYRGFFNGFKFKDGTEPQIYVLPRDKFAAEVVKDKPGTTPEIAARQRGIKLGNGKVLVNGDFGAGSGTEAPSVLGHEAGGHVAQTIIELLAPEIDASMQQAATRNLLKNGKPNQRLRNFIDAYNKAVDPTGKHVEIQNKEHAIQEFLAEQARQAMEGGPAKFAAGKALRETIQDNLADYFRKLFGTKHKFDREDVPTLGREMRSMLFELGRLRGDHPDPAAAAAGTPPAGAPEAPKGPEPAAPGSNNKEAVKSALQALGWPSKMASTMADAAQGATVEEMVKDALAKKQVAPSVPPQTPAAAPVVPAEGQNAVAGQLSGFDALSEAARQTKERALAEIDPDEKATSSDDLSTSGTPGDAEQLPVGNAPAGAGQVPAVSAESITAALEGADAAGQVRADRAKSDTRKAAIIKEERLKALSGLLHPEGEGLKPVTDEETGKVAFRGDVDPANPVHAAILGEFGYTPEHVATIQALQSTKGKGVYLRDYNAAEQVGHETGEGLDLSGEARGKEYEASRTGELGQRQGNVTKQDKAFTPYDTVLTNKGVLIRGFDHDKFLHNLRSVLDAKEGLDGKKLDVSDEEIADAFRKVAENHANGWKGDGSEQMKTFPDTGIEQNLDYVGQPVEKELAEVVNMAMHIRLSKRTAKEAQGLAQINDGFLNPETGETNALRDRLEKNGFETDKQLKPTVSNVRPDLIEGGISDTPTHGRNVHSHGFDITPADLTTVGTPHAKQTAAGFMPGDGELSNFSPEEETSIKSKITNPLANFMPGKPPTKEEEARFGKGFYSQLERTVEAKLPNKFKADQAWNTIKNAPGIKADELEFTDVENWLKKQTGTVTKEALLDYLHDSNVRLTTVDDEASPVKWVVRNDNGEEIGTYDSEREAERARDEMEREDMDHYLEHNGVKIEEEDDGTVYIVKNSQGREVERFDDPDDLDEYMEEHKDEGLKYEEEDKIKWVVYDSDGDRLKSFDDESDADSYKERREESLMNNYESFYSVEESSSGEGGGSRFGPGGEYGDSYYTHGGENYKEVRHVAPGKGKEVTRFEVMREGNPSPEVQAKYDALVNRQKAAYDKMTEMDKPEVARERTHEQSVEREELSREVRDIQRQIRELAAESGGMLDMPRMHAIADSEEAANKAVAEIAERSKGTARGVIKPPVTSRQPAQSYTRSHWDEADTVAHTREQDFDGIDDANVRLVDEFQSDWIQQARDMRKDAVEAMAKEKGISEKEADKLVSKNYSFEETPHYFYGNQAIPRKGPFMTQEAAEASLKATLSDPLYTTAPATWRIAPESATHIPGEGRINLYRVETEDGQHIHSAYVANPIDAIHAAEQKREQGLKTAVTESKSSPMPEPAFKTTWSEMAFKKSLRKAIEDGMDRIGWTKGIEHVKRYEAGLRQSVDRIDWYREPDSNEVKITATKDGNASFTETVPLEGRKQIQGKDASLKDVVGKSMAEAIKNSQDNSGSFEGDELAIGGEGMQGFYDDILPKTIQKIVQKLDPKAKVRQTRIADEDTGTFHKYFAKMEPVQASPEEGEKLQKAFTEAQNKMTSGPMEGPEAEQNVRDYREASYALNYFTQHEGTWQLKSDKGFVDDKGNVISDYPGKNIPPKYFETKEEAENWLKDRLEMYGKKIWSVDITPEMKEKVQSEGMAIFMPGEASGKEGKPLEDFETDSLGFYSGLSSVIDKKVPKRASGDQILATLKGAGAKQEEMEAIGLPEYLKTQPGPVSKEDLKNFVKAGGIQLKEVTKGETETWSADDEARLSELERLSSRGTITDEEGEEFVRLMERENDFLDQQASYGTSAGMMPKYGQYTLPGGENYKEVLLTLPTKSEVVKYEAFEKNGKWGIRRTGDSGKLEEWVPPSLSEEFANNQVKQYNRESEEYGGRPTKDNFRSSHWDEPNVLAHIRQADHEDTEGNKVRLIEEIQSDWHQKGRKHGYRKGDDSSELDRLEKEQEEAEVNFGKVRDKVEASTDTGDLREVTDRGLIRELQEAREKWNAARDAAIAARQVKEAGVPDAPFKKTWAELAFKRALRQAVEDGMDKIAWTPGNIQNERYSLDKHIGLASLLKSKDEGKYTIYLEDKDGRSPIFRNVNGFSEHGQKTVTPQELADLVGKDVADRLVAGADKTKDAGDPAWFDIRGERLKIEGEGMKGFYDKILPSFVSKYVKKWGGKVETTKLAKTGQGAVSGIDVMNDMGMPRQAHDQFWRSLDDEQRSDLITKYRAKHDGKTVHSVTITPEMREAILKGQPLFMPGGEENQLWDFNLKEHADKAGAIYQGQEKGLHAFKELSTNGNFSLKDVDLSPTAIQKGADEVRKSFEAPTVTEDTLDQWLKDNGFEPKTASSIKSKVDEGLSNFMPGEDRKQAQKDWAELKTEAPAFKRWFGKSKVVDDEGNPIKVYSGHANVDMYGDAYDPKKTTAGGFYATEDPDIASNYSLGKMGVREEYPNGGQYRFQQKNGKFAKKLWQMELTPEQTKAAREWLNSEESGVGHNMEEYWKEHSQWDKDARRRTYRGLTLQNIHDQLEEWGNGFRDNSDEAGQTYNSEKPLFMRQGKTTFEELLDKIGVKWKNYEFASPGVQPLYLKIENPIDASQPFPAELLNALDKASKRERNREASGTEWTHEYPLKQWVKDIKNGDEYWSTHIPAKALPIIKSYGYDGIKEVGSKGEADRSKRQINWIAFDPAQIKSASGNQGTFDPEKVSMNLMPGDGGPKRTWFLRDGKRVYHKRKADGKFAPKLTLAGIDFSDVESGKPKQPLAEFAP